MCVTPNNFNFIIIFDYAKGLTYVSGISCIVAGIKTSVRTCKIDEPRHEKTNILHMRKQRRRSASR